MTSIHPLLARLHEAKETYEYYAKKREEAATRYETLKKDAPEWTEVDGKRVFNSHNKYALIEARSEQTVATREMNAAKKLLETALSNWENRGAMREKLVTRKSHDTSHALFYYRDSIREHVNEALAYFAAEYDDAGVETTSLFGCVSDNLDQALVSISAIERDLGYIALHLLKSEAPHATD